MNHINTITTRNLQMNNIQQYNNKVLKVHSKSIIKYNNYLQFLNFLRTNVQVTHKSSLRITQTVADKLILPYKSIANRPKKRNKLYIDVKYNLSSINLSSITCITCQITKVKYMAQHTQI